MAPKKPEDDVQTLIDNQVYMATTVDVVDPMEEEIRAELSEGKRQFESRGMHTLVVSTILVGVLILSFLYIQVQYYESSMRKPDGAEEVGVDPHTLQNSSWRTTYEIPENFPFYEISTTSFASMLPNSPPCPSEPSFALVVYVDDGTEVTAVEPWLMKCGASVRYFRMNGILETKDVDRIMNYVPNAQFIPITAEYVGVKDPEVEILTNPDFKDRIEGESNVITILKLSGHVTSKDIDVFKDILPYVEELTLESNAELCQALYRPPGQSQASCQVYWGELRVLRFVRPEKVGEPPSSLVEECTRTLEMIDMCWQLPQLKRLEVTGTSITQTNARYISDIIDRYRVTNVSFVDNTCTVPIPSPGEDFALSDWAFMCDTIHTGL